jgi:hypothetical protein
MLTLQLYWGDKTHCDRGPRRTRDGLRPQRLTGARARIHMQFANSKGRTTRNPNASHRAALLKDERWFGRTKFESGRSGPRRSSRSSQVQDGLSLRQQHKTCTGACRYLKPLDSYCPKAFSTDTKNRNRVSTIAFMPQDSSQTHAIHVHQEHVVLKDGTTPDETCITIYRYRC